MAQVTTERHPLMVAGEPETNVSYGVKDGFVRARIRNDLVTHEVAYDPDEAIRVGVMMIQMAHGALMQRAAKQVAVPNLPAPLQANGLKIKL